MFKKEKPGWRQIKPRETETGAFIMGPPRRTASTFLKVLFFVITVVGIYCSIHGDMSWWGFPIMIGAWSAIAAGETDADSPLNQTLMDKIRGNLDYLKDDLLPAKIVFPLLNFTGWAFSDVTVELTGATAEITLTDGIYISIPAEATKVTIHANLSVTYTAGTPKWRYSINGAYTSSQTLTQTGAKWYSLDKTPVTGGSVQEIVIKVNHTTGYITKDFTLHELIVEAFFE